MERRVKKGKEQEDKILAYVEILEQGLKRLREEVSTRARG